MKSSRSNTFKQAIAEFERDVSNAAAKFEMSQKAKHMRVRGKKNPGLARGIANPKQPSKKGPRNRTRSREVVQDMKRFGDLGRAISTLRNQEPSKARDAAIAEIKLFQRQGVLPKAKFQRRNTPKKKAVMRHMRHRLKKVTGNKNPIVKPRWHVFALRNGKRYYATGTSYRDPFDSNKALGKAFASKTLALKVARAMAQKTPHAVQLGICN